METVARISVNAKRPLPSVPFRAFRFVSRVGRLKGRVFGVDAVQYRFTDRSCTQFHQKGNHIEEFRFVSN